MSKWAMLGSVSLALLGSSVAGAQQVERDPQGIFAADDLESLWNGGFFLEGPAMGPDGFLYFSDITFTASSGGQAGYIWRFNPATRTAEIFRSPSGMANGLLFDLDERLVAALGADFGGRAVVRTDMESGRSEILAGLFEGRRLNSPNDLAIDERGRIYFTDPRYDGHEPIDQPVMGVYRIDPDGSLHRIIKEAGRPNGILVSPDQTTLYVASVEPAGWYGDNALLAFDLEPDGTVGPERVLVDMSPDEGPDGMAIDVDGNIYAARMAVSPGIYVYAPDGQELAFLRTPEPPANAAFGRGEYSRTLFITAGRSLYAIRTSREGYQPPRR